MKALVCAIVLCFVLACVAVADTPNKVTLDAKAMTLKDAADTVSKQAGVSIVLDPKATGTVTANLSNADLSQVLDVMTKGNKLSWKKLQFARSQDSKVSLEQIKSGILALANMPLVGLAVNDPTTKTGTVFAKNMPTEADASSIGLPEGYSWSTVYVVLAPEPVAAPSTTGNKLADLTKSNSQQLVDVANLSPEERKQYYASQWQQTMNLAPEARQAMLRDQMEAMRNLPQQQRDMLRQDFRSAFGGGQRPQGQNQGGNRGRRSN